MTATIWDPAGEIIQLANANRTLLTQAFTASGGQTEFDLSNFNYAPGVGSLFVFINGVYQISGVDYTETSSSRFDIIGTLVAGDLVVAVGFVGITTTVDLATLQALLLASTGAGLIGWIQSGTGAVYRLVRDKLRDLITTPDFG